MTANPAPETRTVVLRRAEHPYYPPNYWPPLVGLRMPAGVVDGRTLEGLLVAAEESEDEITLVFSEVGWEG